MGKKCVYMLFFFAVLFGVSILTVAVHQVQAQLLTVYIRANGDVDHY
jgi:hypothetical protein